MVSKKEEVWPHQGLHLALSPTQTFRGLELCKGWLWYSGLAELTLLCLFIQPERHDHSFLIPRVGHFSRYERKAVSGHPFNGLQDQLLLQKEPACHKVAVSFGWAAFGTQVGILSVKTAGLNACCVLSHCPHSMGPELGPPQKDTFALALEPALASDRKQRRKDGLVSL